MRSPRSLQSASYSLSHRVGLEPGNSLGLSLGHGVAGHVAQIAFGTGDVIVVALGELTGKEGGESWLPLERQQLVRRCRHASSRAGDAQRYPLPNWRQVKLLQ